jgi:acyl-[acyl-carrier-protein]-phospholipid O-acyltransferase/long-chain-fatty-acid--[acyl-carrier-protein] ligase
MRYGRALAASLIFSERFRGLEKGFVGIMIPTSAACSLTVLGALMSGRTPVMINYSTGAAENARYAQKKCGFRTIITSRALIEKIGCPFVDGMVFIEDIVGGISIAEKLKGGLTARLPVSLILRSIHGGEEDDDLVVLFTSGSEKNPKAVELTHRNIFSNIESFSEAVGLSDQDRMFANLPFFHVFGLTINLWTPLYHGMTIISYANPTDYSTIVSRIRCEKPTVMAGTPGFLQGYLRKSEQGDFRSLRLVVCGADKCPETVRQEFHEKHGITLYEGYGATETSPVISVNTPGDNKPGSVGKPLPGVQVRIEDYETGEDCPPGRTGRILVSGDAVMKGYYGDLEETSMRIRHGWYDTGDMGFVDEDGFLWHAGRLKRFVKIGGEMVSLVKVEDVLERLLPADVSCCVVDIPDVRKGAKIVAAVTKAVDERMLLQRMAGHLPNISLPRQMVVIEELPKMGSGKIDFRRVAEMVRERLAHSSVA